MTNPQNQDCPIPTAKNYEGLTASGKTCKQIDICMNFRESKSSEKE